MTHATIKTPKQFGSVLKDSRGRRKLSQQALGDSIGWTQSAISLIEAEAGSANLARIFKVLAALDLELVIRSRRDIPE